MVATPALKTPRLRYDHLASKHESSPAALGRYPQYSAIQKRPKQFEMYHLRKADTEHRLRQIERSCTATCVASSAH